MIKLGLVLLLAFGILIGSALAPTELATGSVYTRCLHKAPRAHTTRQHHIRQRYCRRLARAAKRRHKPPIPQSTRFGFSPGATLYNENPNQDLDAAKNAGAKRIRIDLNWAIIQSGGPTSYNWSQFDPIVSGAQARGLDVLADPVYTPSWARPSGTSATYGPDPAQYAAFVRTAALHYPQIHEWEIWNEPNITSTWTPKPDPVHYTAVLKAAYTAIKNVNSSATVVTGGTAPAPSDGTQISPNDFVRGIYDAGGQSYFNAIGQHPYCFPADPGSSDQWSAWWQMVNLVRPLMVARGDSAKQIWLTEFGAPTHDPAWPQLDESTQARYVSEAYSLTKSYSWAGPLFWYSVRDRGTNTGDREDWFGLLRNDFSAKPGYSAYQQAVASG